jgi:hypothetical protein
MVLQINPFCPISFGFLGFLSAVVSRRSSLLKPLQGTVTENDEEDDFLMSKQEDYECDELNEEKISNFLESQRDKYYKSIGMDPPSATKPGQSSMNASSSTSCTDFSTPSQSMIEFPSSRETSLFMDDSLIDPSLISIPSSISGHVAATAQSFCIDKDVVSPLPSEDEVSRSPLVQFKTTSGDTIVEENECPPELVPTREPQKKSKRQSSGRRSQKST